MTCPARPVVRSLGMRSVEGLDLGDDACPGGVLTEWFLAVWHVFLRMRCCVGGALGLDLHPFLSMTLPSH